MNNKKEEIKGELSFSNLPVLTRQTEKKSKRTSVLWNLMGIELYGRKLSETAPLSSDLELFELANKEKTENHFTAEHFIRESIKCELLRKSHFVAGARFSFYLFPQMAAALPSPASKLTAN
ncbi:hypothetical protein GWI33_006715 [Rhynchophorus ferrugineus]|uniref:Uncharacterized protein n=1 Tax=Rhynchophorus ferrugineus TaxID=354439 RepID=A0A834MMP9_RHYFE|nr:hypothetical protein GWI33_006715 [Rhynchophorus ferrugineus]